MFMQSFRFFSALFLFATVICEMLVVKEFVQIKKLLNGVARL